MTEADTLLRLRQEVDRACSELRESMRQMAIACQLPTPLMSVCTLMDRIEVGVTRTGKDASFDLEEASGVVNFNADTLATVIERTDDFADEVGYRNRAERYRLVQLAVNLFILHELLHVVQHFPHFASVRTIKAGMPGYGLPMLDVAADTVAAWVTAHVEAQRLGQTDEQSILRSYANTLILAYVVGAFVFEVVGRAPKMQRALGLLTSAALVEAQADGRLSPGSLNAVWKPLSPLIVLDLQSAGAFNAVVLDTFPGMLIANFDESETSLVKLLWNSVGKRPVRRTLELVSQILLRLGVIAEAPKDVVPQSTRRRAAD
ncbi:hypothetical protein [Brevundimonas sp.]|uniref:hypothetical protein n=1 Tax=Brevundimonas sp. TaxID=1871086 RepID=UPI003AF823DE